MKRTVLVLGLGMAAWTRVAAETPHPRDVELESAAKTAEVVRVGRETFAGLCQACHGDASAQGDAASNLFDAKWHHGAKPHEIERTILNGIVDKGMPGWGEVLAPEDTTALTAFLLSAQK